MDIDDIAIIGISYRANGLHDYKALWRLFSSDKRILNLNIPEPFDINQMDNTHFGANLDKLIQPQTIIFEEILRAVEDANLTINDLKIARTDCYINFIGDEYYKKKEFPTNKTLDIISKILNIEFSSGMEYTNMSSLSIINNSRKEIIRNCCDYSIIVDCRSVIDKSNCYYSVSVIIFSKRSTASDKHLNIHSILKNLTYYNKRHTCSITKPTCCKNELTHLIQLAHKSKKIDVNSVSFIDGSDIKQEILSDSLNAIKDNYGLVNEDCLNTYQLINEELINESNDIIKIIILSLMLYSNNQLVDVNNENKFRAGLLINASQGGEFAYLVFEPNLSKKLIIQKVKESLPEAFKEDEKINLNKLEHVFLTGCTGVLGSYLLKMLIERGDCVIYCLVRAMDIEKAYERIVDALSVYGNFSENYKSRIHPVLGDIKRDNLGVSNNVYNDLVQKIDVTIHSAALTNLLLPYEMIKDTNVDGTKRIVDFVMTTHNKYLIYVSSYSLMGDLSTEKISTFKEDDLDLSQKFYNGYQESKFMAEKLIHNATKNGLIFNIVRPGNIYGESATGNYPFKQVSVSGIYYEMLEMAINSGISFKGNYYYDITPVDFVARSIISLCLLSYSSNKTYHLLNPDKKHWYEIVEILNHLNYNIKFIPTSEYVELVSKNDSSLNYRLEKREQRVLPFTKLILQMAPSMFNDSIYANTEFTQKLLKEKNIQCPKIDKTLIGILLDQYSKQTENIKRINK